MAAYGVDPYGRPTEVFEERQDERRRREEEEERNRPRESQGESQNQPGQQPAQNGPGAADQVNQLYREHLGRDANEQGGRELASDIENLQKYGADALRENLRVRGLSGGDRDKGGYDTDLPDDPAERARVLSAQQGSSSASGSNGQSSRPSLANYPTYQRFSYADRALPTYTGSQFGQTLPTYSGATFDQFSAPTTGNVQNLQQSLIERILNAPETLTPEALAAMREQQKEEALAFEAQARDAMQRDAIGRGLDLGVGARGAADRRLRSDTVGTLVQGNRDLALAKVERDRADQLAASGLASDFLDSTLNRATSAYDTRLRGQMAQADEGFRGFTTQADAQRFAAEQEARRAAEQRAAIASQIQSILFEADEEGRLADEHRFAYGAEADRARFGEGARQFDSTLGENSRQFDRRLGYDYTALGSTLQQALINAILNS